MRNRSAVGVVAALWLAACGQAPSETSQHIARGPMVNRARAAVYADRPLIHTIVQQVTKDARSNATAWFGKRGHRTPASVCGGLTRLLAKHMVAFDSARNRVRTADQRLAAARSVVKAVRCGERRTMSLYGTPLLAAMMSPVAVPDSVDDWLADNWHPDSWSVAVQNFTDNGPGPIDPYTTGMTEFEVANLEAVACSQDLTVEELGDAGGGDDEEGEDPMLMYYWPAWTKSVLIGCGSNVIVNISDIAGGVRLGASLWGPWGAAAGGTAVALEHCLYGAIAGYYVWKLAQT